METTSLKKEILSDLKELKEKGVRIIMHDSFMQKNVSNGNVINGGPFVIMGSCINGYESETKVRVLKNAEELTINIYSNSSESDIVAQISAVKQHIDILEKEAKTTAIVDFLKDELK